MKSRRTEPSRGAEETSPSARITIRPLGKVRWQIAGVLGVGTLVNYLDRVNLSVAGPLLQRDYHLTPADLGIVLSAFSWSYFVMQIPVGMLLDKLGVKWIQRIGTVLWTASTFLTAVVSGLGLIIVMRSVLGIAEAPSFPASMKATGHWFPRNERGLCTAIFGSGSSISSIIGLPLMAVVVTQFGWRSAFVATGILSGLYAVLFWVFYRNPKELLRKRKLSEEEYRYISEGAADDEEAVQANQWSNLLYLLRQRKTWGFILGFAGSSYALEMLFTWLPEYLVLHHMTVLNSGFFAAIPYVASLLATILLSGWLVDRLVMRGFDQNKVRKFFLIGGFVIALAIAGAAFTNNVAVALVFISIATAGTGMSGAVGNSLTALLAPEGSAGVLGGLQNGFNRAVGIVAPILTGILVGRTGNFSAAFAVAAVFLLLGITAYVLLLGKIERMPSRGTKEIQHLSANRSGT